MHGRRTMGVTVYEGSEAGTEMGAVHAAVGRPMGTGLVTLAIFLTCCAMRTKNKELIILGDVNILTCLTLYLLVQIMPVTLCILMTVLILN